MSLEKLRGTLKSLQSIQRFPLAELVMNFFSGIFASFAAQSRGNFWLEFLLNCYFNCSDRDRKKNKSQRRDRILHKFVPPSNRAIFSTFGVICLLNYTVNLEKRERTSTGENSRNPVETARRNCRFLSCVVVEHVLI